MYYFIIQDGQGKNSPKAQKGSLLKGCENILSGYHHWCCCLSNVEPQHKGRLPEVWGRQLDPASLKWSRKPLFNS